MKIENPFEIFAQNDIILKIGDTVRLSLNTALNNPAENFQSAIVFSADSLWQQQNGRSRAKAQTVLICWMYGWTHKSLFLLTSS